jgi:hypothetical protein
MHVVAISSWNEETTDLVQLLARALGITVFEARPRMLGHGPSVVASFADSEMALALAKKLNLLEFATLIVDVTAVRSRAGYFIVRRFQFNKQSMLIETSGGQKQEIPYEEIDLLLPGTSSVETSETKSYTEHKLSIGKTLLSGGIPMVSKVEHQEKVTTEERGKVLHLYAGKRAPVILSQNGVTYEGFGAAMKLSRELNFAHLISELRKFSPAAGYDDRLLNRVGQVRLLGPTFNPETNLDLAAEILARSLRHGSEAI